MKRKRGSGKRKPKFAPMVVAKEKRKPKSALVVVAKKAFPSIITENTQDALGLDDIANAALDSRVEVETPQNGRNKSRQQADMPETNVSVFANVLKIARSMVSKSSRGFASGSTEPSSDTEQVQDGGTCQKEPNVPYQDPQYKEQELKASLAVIRRVMKMEAAGPFNVPVDPIALRIPDYFDVIDTPMDFGTICSNLENGVKYKNSKDVLRDVQYIWDNCRKYNKKGHYVLKLLKQVKSQFTKFWREAGLYTEQQQEIDGTGFQLRRATRASRSRCRMSSSHDPPNIEEDAGMSSSHDPPNTEENAGMSSSHDPPNTEENAGMSSSHDPPNTEEDVGLSAMKEKGNKRKVRGSTTLPEVIRNRSFGLREVVQYNPKGLPVGNVAKKYCSYLGVLARTMIPIVYKDWHKVPAELKEKVWSSVELAYVVDPRSKKNVIMSVGEKWRTFKKNLTKIILGNMSDPELLSKPPIIYSFVEQGHWDSFVRERLTEDFQALSQLQRERRSKLLYNHRLSRKGYAQFELECKSATGSTDEIDRSIMWKKARQNKNGEYDDKAIIQQVAKIDELTKQAQDGKLSITGDSDILTMALGTPEHSCRTRGVGSFITPKRYFNLPRRVDHSRVDHSRVDHSRCEEKHKSLEAIVIQMQAQLNTLGQQTRRVPQSEHVTSNTLKSDNIVSPLVDPISKDSRARIHVDMPPPDPKHKNQKSKHCKLAVGSLDNIVAYGKIHEGPGPQDVMHTVPVEEAIIPVCIDVAIVKDALLPIPIPGEATLVGDAIGYQLGWPKQFVLISSEETPRNDDCEIFLESIQSFSSLVEHVKYDETISIQVEKEIFGDEINIQLQRVDMEYVCQKTELSVTCMMLYISHLHQVIKASNLERNFLFMNPYAISGRIKSGTSSKSDLLASRLDDAKNDQLLFVPYNVGYHWILLVIDPSLMTVYYLDSLNNEINPSLEILISTGLKIYEFTKKKRRTSLVWKVVQCPQQCSNVECGFYVMKYMKDLIRDPSILNRQNFNGKRTYTDIEVDEVRVDWINFVLKNM